MTTGLDLIRELGVRSQGRDPVWAAQGEAGGAPSGGSEGVDVTGAILALFAVALRRDPSAHQSYVEITTADLSATTYTVTIDGNAVDYDASAENPSDQDALVQGIAAAINNDGTVGALVSASAIDDDNDGTLDTVLIRNDDADETVTHTTAVSVSGGTGALSASEDADAASVRLWGRPEYQSGELASVSNTAGVRRIPWVLVNNGSFAALDYRGLTERADVAGFARLYLELFDVTGPSGSSIGAVQIQVGPCSDEGVGS